MLIPMVLAKPARPGSTATICTVGSVLGGISAMPSVISSTRPSALADPGYGLAKQFEAYRAAYNEWGLWIILIEGLTAVPDEVVTIASGAAAFNVWVFIAASIVTRGARFFLVAALLYWLGEPIREFIERRLTLVTTAFVVLLVGGFVAIKYVL